MMETGEGRRGPRRLRSDWRQNWTVRLAATSNADDAWPEPLYRFRSGHTARDWRAALEIEARIHRVTREEVLAGRIDPGLEAEREIHAEARAALSRKRDADRLRSLRARRFRGFALLGTLILGGMLGCLSAYQGGHDGLAVILAAVGGLGVILLLKHPEVEI